MTYPSSSEPPELSAPVQNKPRWERRKDARPQELLAAALELFVEKGFAAARLEDVAQRAGVSKGTLYLYFANKEELFKAVVRENVVPLIGQAEELIAQFSGPSEQLFRDILHRWWEHLGKTHLSGLTKLVMSEAGNFPEIASFYYDEVIQRAYRVFDHVLERGVTQEEFRAIDIPMVRNLLIAPIIMLMLWKHSFGPCAVEAIDPKRYVDTLIDMSLHGLALNPPTNDATNDENNSRPIAR